MNTRLSLLFPSMFGKVENAILANGSFPQNPLTLSMFDNASFLVCCDGAVEKLSNKTPDAIVGDLDSLSDGYKEKYRHLLHKIDEQDTNDLTKSVEYCISNGKKRLTIFGATGLRDDHAIGNISLLAEYNKIAGVAVEMVTDFGVFNSISETTDFQSFAGQQVSIFEIGGGRITTANLKYPIANRQLTNWWQGTLNESVADTFTIETDSVLIVFRKFI